MYLESFNAVLYLKNSIIKQLYTKQKFEGNPILRNEQKILLSSQNYEKFEVTYFYQKLENGYQSSQIL